MNIRYAIFILLGSLRLLIGGFAQSLSTAPTTEMVARLHWLGLNQISTNTNATHFMSVWQLPQTTALVAQTLDKYSRWPSGGATNAVNTLLRPLLDDFLVSESYLEIYAPTGSQSSTKNPQLFVAIHLTANRAKVWQTNLVAVSVTLTGTNVAQRIEFTRVGEWTLVAVGSGIAGRMPEFISRIPQAKSNYWLEADLDARLVSKFSLVAGGAGWGEVGSLSALNHIHLTVSSESGNLLTRAIVNFPHPLDLRLSPWEIPTNVLHAPLTSFTAVRGLAPWLAVWPAWQKLQLNPSPDQAYFWAQEGSPFQTYFAVPLPAASNQLSQLAARLVQNVNPWLVTNGQGNFQWATNLPGVAWKDMSLIDPFLKSVVVNHHDYLLGGLIPLAEGDSSPVPAEIPRAVLGTPNLVYYHTELTGDRIEDGLFIGQLFRVAFHKPQLPAVAAATLWLKNVEPLLGASTTSVTLSGTEQLTFTRNSTIGFTALELHLLADWLESPQFPHGLHTFLAPP